MSSTSLYVRLEEMRPNLRNWLMVRPHGDFYGQSKHGTHKRTRMTQSTGRTMLCRRYTERCSS